ncbi:MAG TPA: hypothetical protein VD908_13120 [Cytophagales bacterium]|nr:hypothetical protein [Cytophagales bacterium]
MYKYVKHKDINYYLWDECIEQSPNGIIYALSWYLNIVSPDWDAIIKEEKGKYKIVLPVTKQKKYLINILKKPILTYGLGLIGNNIEKTDCSDVMKIITKRFLIVNEYLLNEHQSEFNLPQEFNLNLIQNFTIDLTLGYEKIYKNYSLNRKRDIKMASRQGIKVRNSDDLEGFIQEYTKNTGNKITGFLGEQFENKIIRNVYQSSVLRGYSKLLEVVNEESKIVCSGIFLIYKGRISYLLGQSNTEGRQSGAMSYLIDYLIRTNDHLKIFDFSGSYLSNLAIYFQRFGATKTEFGSISKNELPIIVKTAMRVRRFLIARTKF